MKTPLNSIEGAYLWTPEMHLDDRGFFASLDFPPSNGPHRWCVARSSRCVIRGLHLRSAPGEAKLVRCSAGAVVDYIVDLRRGSPTYRHWAEVYLDGGSQIGSQIMLYIPPGCAHGYQALEDNTDMTYRIDAEYDPGAELVIAWNDPELAIPWPLPPGVMSDRDKKAPTLKELGL